MLSVDLKSYLFFLHTILIDGSEIYWHQTTIEAQNGDMFLFLFYCYKDTFLSCIYFHHNATFAFMRLYWTPEIRLDTWAKLISIDVAMATQLLYPSQNREKVRQQFPCRRYCRSIWRYTMPCELVKDAWHSFKLVKTEAFSKST